MRDILLVRFGEVYLKGLNRPQFMRVLVNNIRHAAQPYGGHVWMQDGRIYIRDASDPDACAHKVAAVFGVHSVSQAVQMDKSDIDALLAQASRMMEPLSGTFKVKARRSDKNYPYDSPALCQIIGRRIADDHPGLIVDVRRPEHVLEVEIRDEATLHIGRIQGAGGMPMGTSGKACLLLSGGIDSPVAGYMVARRGVQLAAVHFHSYPYTSERARDKVIELARILSTTTGRIELYIASITDIQMRIAQNCAESYGTLLLRRQMMRIAQTIAGQCGAQALITGESLGQVASQTMEALACTDDVAQMPVFRPLIGFDKAEIIERAQAIDTFETSSLPYEDCCTVFTPKHPTTRPQLHKVIEAENAIGDDLQALLDASAAGAQRIVLLDGALPDAAAADSR